MNGNWFRLFLAGLMIMTLVLAGCDDGDDGNNGAPGASAYEIAVDNGFVGTEQEWLDSLRGDTATTAEPEQCAVCHGDVESLHAATGVPALTATGALVGGDFVITANLTVDGVGTDENYQLYRVYKTYTNSAILDPTAITTNERVALLSLRNENASDCTDSATCTIPNDLGAFGSTADGTFTLTVPAAEVVNDAVYTVIIRSLDSTDQYGWGSFEPGALVTLGTSPLRDLVSDDGMSVGCASCHGASASSLFDHYLVSGNECQSCHAIYSRSADFYSQNADGTWTNQGSVPGSNFTEYIHGIHNSHNMPAGEYYRSSSTQWSIGYPSNMLNCASCHVTPVQLAAAVEAPVSFYLCMTCHQDWDGFGDAIPEGDFHRDADVTTDCNGCHGLVSSIDEAGDFHNSIVDSARSSSFYRGVDVSFANEDEATFTIDSVTSDGSNVSFTWSASTTAGAADPCNTDVSLGPVYTGVGAYLAYAKGDDWVNEFVGSAPGQPVGSENLFTDLTTTCAANVATTTGLVLDPEGAAYASKVLLAIGGKIQVQDTFADVSADPLAFYVREPSPTYAFNAADGSAATARRDAVNNEKCLGCHQGTLYQHGGDRVDNEQLCVICHNPSASDKNVRLDTFQVANADGTVNTDATYDGRNAETYDMRTMLHAIHGVEQRLETGGKPWVVYRGRGIYGFGLDDTPLPAGWPADGETVNGSLNASTTPHNWVVVHYPKAVNDCDACHNDGQYEAADQTKAVGVTVDAGFDWPDQSDDTIIGPSAAACTACHAGAAQRSHAESNGYKANVTKDEMLEKAQ
jgi:OmcA/MtrC family decaheme c-type cytochrome